MSETTANLQEFASKRKQPILGTFSLSVIIHAAVIALLGGVVVFKVLERPPAQFKPPPPPAKTVKIEPRKLQHKIKIREQQQNSGRPRVSPRLTANRVSGISLPEIEADPMAAPVKSNIQKNIGKNFSMGGLGTGLGSGTGSGGLGLGTSTVSFFGIQAAGERIAFVIDLSRSMVEDDKGGLNGINVLKDELKNMVQKLNDGTFFNLIFFDDNVDLFKPKLVVAKPPTKKEADQFISPYYADFGKEVLQNYSQDKRDWPSATRLHNYNLPMLESTAKYVGEGGNKNSQIDAPLAAAFQMQADTIFIISDGYPVFERALFGKELEEYQRRVKEAEEKWAKLSPKELERIEKSNQESREKYWKALDAENAKRARRGLPPKVFEEGGPGGTGFGVGRPSLTSAQTIEYIRAVAVELYGDKKKMPKIYTVAYGAQAGGEEFLQSLSREFHGRYRKIRGLAPPVKDKN
jgi:von Willebrand factor type A domain